MSIQEFGPKGKGLGFRLLDLSLNWSSVKEVFLAWSGTMQVFKSEVLGVKSKPSPIESYLFNEP